MNSTGRSMIVGSAGCAMFASLAVAVDLPDPVYTYCEIDNGSMIDADERQISGRGNDLFDYIEIVSAPSEFADCFYITGKLQKDCIWDRQPKCCLVSYSKPLTAFDETGRDIGLVEEVLDVSSPTQGMAHLFVPALDDGTIRLGVGSVFDCFDGTLNGLFSNGVHGDYGEVTVALTYLSVLEGEEAGTERLESHDEEYTFYLGGVKSQAAAPRGYEASTSRAGDALRLAYVLPENTSFVDVWCDDSTGTKEICWDVDYYWVQGLTERELYCVTQVGGKDYHCQATDTILGWYDKNGQLQGGEFGISGGSAGNNVPEYSELCVIADDLGSIRFAISGEGDANFNGLLDSEEVAYFEFLEDEGYLADDNNVVKGENWIPGASTKTNPEDVIRLSREDFDESGYAHPPAHDVCGCYTLKVRLNLHEEDEDDDGDFGGDGLAARADMSGDGFVDAVDLAMLLSFWGPVQ